MAAGGEWGVSEEAIDAMKQLAGSLIDTVEKLKIRLSSLKSAFEENEAGLGAHSDQILTLIEDMDRWTGETETAVKKLSFKLLKAASIRRAHVEESHYGGSDERDLAAASFITDMTGLKSTMSLGEGDLSVKQLGGIHKKVRREDGPGYESHHIPSAAVLKQFGIDTDEWPTIALTNEDHAKTDSYRGKQSRKYRPLFPDGAGGGATYKEEAAQLLDRGGGFAELVRDEIYNIREQCGDKYDGGIAQYLDEVMEYVKKHGVPTRKK